MTEQPIAIQAQGLGKMYRIGGQKQAKYNIRELLTQLSLEPFRRLNALRQGIAPTHSDKMFWALKDINFTIYKGESVGIIGVNGSGKSTLLKIISHIVEPTEGSVRTVGRIASLLEVGAGFHPELTGRENVYLTAQS
jgi:lipopolysaccharide transport system ATP-binding protein